MQRLVGHGITTLVVACVERVTTIRAHHLQDFEGDLPIDLFDGRNADLKVV
jgi:hypothetical protein